jgi:hypothetical protein
MNESNPGVNAWHAIVRLFNNYWIRLSHDVKRTNDIINIIYNIIINNNINIFLILFYLFIFKCISNH